jgi:hypothetical protein
VKSGAVGSPWSLAAVLCGALATSAARGADGLFSLALLREHRADIEKVQDAMQAALPRLTRGTPLANHWAINSSTAASGDLRVVLYRSDAVTNANEVTRAYTDGCETSVPFRLIICDAHLFDELMHHRGFDRETDLGHRDWPVDELPPVVPRSAEEQSQRRLQLVTWVLGHEIGHLSVKSTERTVDVNSFLSEQPAQRLTQTVEVLADQHVFQGSGLVPSERNDLEGFLVTALNAELHLKYCPTLDVVQYCHKIPAGVGILFDYNSVSKLDIDASAMHPEFLLRLIRLVTLTNPPDHCDGICMLLKEVLNQVQAVNRDRVTH